MSTEIVCDICKQIFKRNYGIEIKTKLMFIEGGHELDICDNCFKDFKVYVALHTKEMT